MPVPPKTIQIGKCYLTHAGEVRRVLRLLPEDRVHYETRERAVLKAFGWKEGVLELAPFAVLVEREVPCGWTPEGDSEGPGVRARDRE